MKMERLIDFMFEEDEIRVKEGKEPLYFTKEDFEAEKEERKNNKPADALN